MSRGARSGSPVPRVAVNVSPSAAAASATFVAVVLEAIVAPGSRRTSTVDLEITET